MSSLLVIRLHPEEPIPGDDFTTYLEGLSIIAYELSFDNPDGSESDSEIDTAVYIPLDFSETVPAK